MLQHIITPEVEKVHCFRARIPDAAAELNGILSDEVLAGSNVPVLILANKIDLPGALGEFELAQSLGIYDRQVLRVVRLLSAQICLSRQNERQPKQPSQMASAYIFSNL